MGEVQLFMKRWPVWIMMILFAAACAGIWLWSLNGEFGACVKGTIGDTLQKTITTVDGIIELAIKLSITLVGAGAALLLGLKSGMRLTPGVKVLTLTAVLLFGQASLAGVWWRRWVANSWLNECLNLVSEPVMQRLFSAAFIFFMAGLVMLLIMLCYVVWSTENQKGGGHET
jgi:hypothetical protein